MIIEQDIIKKDFISPSKNSNTDISNRMKQYIYGTRCLSRSTTPRRIAGNKDVPDMTMIMIIMFMKISSTNNVIPLLLEQFLILKNNHTHRSISSDVTRLKDHFD
jgi:hypothetical protein